MGKLKEVKKPIRAVVKPIRAVVIEYKGVLFIDANGQLIDHEYIVEAINSMPDDKV